MIMWSNIIKIAFQPEFNPSFKKFIKDNVSPDFITQDNDVCQYSVEKINDAVNDNLNITFMEFDLLILEELIEDFIEYVEF